MAGTDVYNNTDVGSSNWSDTVDYTPASGNTPASVEVGGVAASDVVLNGTVAAAGNPVTATFSAYGQSIQEQLAAVFDIIGGAVFTDSYGDYYLFSDAALTQGDTYAAAPGFGLFADGSPNPACFAAGTRIETSRGPVAVESLRPGDQVRALLREARGGGFAPVVWTGRLPIACARHPAPQDVWPVRVAAGAFGPGRPTRALFLSPDHAVYERGVLVPIRHLLNDATVKQVEVGQITYWHVELPAHDVLLAEGLPAESYLDTGTRAAFIPGDAAAGPTASTVVPIAPNASAGLAARTWERLGCARLVRADAELAPLRRRLREHARIAGWRETGDAGLALHAGGACLDAEWNGTVALATIPPGADAIRLFSRSVIPCQLGEGSTDFRRLGVAVTRLCIDGRDVPLDDVRLRDGWHRVEGGWRWTDGAASIALTAARRDRGVAIHTAPMLTYWQPPRRTGAARQAA
jgi:hypothetical protein